MGESLNAFIYWEINEAIEGDKVNLYDKNILSAL